MSQNLRKPLTSMPVFRRTVDDSFISSVTGPGVSPKVPEAVSTANRINHTSFNRS